VQVSPALIRSAIVKLGLEVFVTLQSSFIRPPVRGGLLAGPVPLPRTSPFAPESWEGYHGHPAPRYLPVRETPRRQGQAASGLLCVHPTSVMASRP
jgi:hypothetical protein